MKICEDCAYLINCVFCKAPENGTSPVTGKPIHMFASERRSSGVSVFYPDTVKCGPDAQHFCQKLIEPKKPWWKFWINK